MASATSFLSEPRFLSEAAQVRAKGVLTEVTGEVPSWNWTYSAERMARNLTAAWLSATLPEARRIEGQERPSDAQMRLVAEVWEALGKLQEGSSRRSALVNAAAAYELAGFQANAACIARSLYRIRPGTEPQTIEELALTFLQRHLVSLRLSVPSFVPQGLPDGVDIGSLALSIGDGLIARGLDRMAVFLLRGDADGEVEARRLLGMAAELFVQSGEVDRANLAWVLSGLLPVIRRRSTWDLLKGVSGNEPMWDRYLKLLSRGPGRMIERSSSVSELWPSQITAIEHGLLNQAESKVIRMPTSAGKTRIAEMAIAHTLISDPSARCVYVAPFRALAAEIEEGFYHLFSDLGIGVSSVLGNYETDAFEQMVLQGARLLVLTPEKLDMLNRLGSDALTDVKLVVVDEGHILDDPTRGLKFELLMTRLKRRLAEARFIFLSAVVPASTLREFGVWLAGTTDSVVASDWRPSLQRVASFSWQGNSGVIRYVGSDDEDPLPGFVPGVISQRKYQRETPKLKRIAFTEFPDRGSKSQTAAELAFKFAEVGAALVFCPQVPLVESVGKALLSRLEYAITGEELPQYFSIRPPHSAEIAAEWLGTQHLVTRLARFGVGLHYGRLPNAVKRALEADVRARRLRVVVATNTLAQGVNLPIRTVIVHSCYRMNEHANRMERITARDYWNIAGRAGRAREETDGLVIHLVFNPTDRSDFAHFLRTRTELEPVRSALLQVVRDIVSERLTVEEATAVLDPEVMALMVEEGIGSDEVGLDRLTAVLDQSLAAVQSPDLTQTAGGLLALVVRHMEGSTTPETRSVFSPTGLRSESCAALLAQVTAHAEGLRALLQGATAADLVTLVELVVSAAVLTHEGQPGRETEAGHVEFVRTWMSGQSLDEMARLVGAEVSLEEVAGFVEDFCAYRLPWVAGAFVRIAAQTLGLEPQELAPYAAFLPAMIRSGVPTPEATWALTAGVESRAAAIDIGSRFVQETSDTTFGAFLAWLKTKSDGEPEAEEISEAARLSIVQSLVRTGRNPYLTNFTGLADILPETVAVRGVRFSDGRHLLVRAKVEDPVELRRDFDNPVDRNAIAAVFLNNVIGYLPRDFAQVLAPELDTGATVRTRIVALDGVATDRPSVSIEIG